ncbi:MAG TPA: DNA-3-methyladenine glycosylase, partial [Opitutales bacterium]|nr:DNA-3-methyladenine glycosylase [Opitutales bacterium]
MSALRPIPASFFQRPTLEVSRELLGANLCREIGGQVVRLPVVEVEAYDGPDDLASHASRGETPRNRVMFEEGGVWYVYLCYGIH